MIQRLSLDSVLACSLLVVWSFQTRVTFCAVSLLRAFCVDCAGFVIHAHIEKCSQVIHDDRRTGSRAVLLLAHQEKVLRHYASIPHHLSCCLQIAVTPLILDLVLIRVISCSPRILVAVRILFDTCDLLSNTSVTCQFSVLSQKQHPELLKSETAS